MEKKFPIEYGTKNICENPNIWEKIFVAIKDIKFFARYCIIFSTKKILLTQHWNLWCKASLVVCPEPMSLGRIPV